MTHCPGAPDSAVCVRDDIKSNKGMENDTCPGAPDSSVCVRDDIKSHKGMENDTLSWST